MFRVTAVQVSHKSVFKYYGGKFYQQKDIYSLLEENQEKFDLVLDVFGGSGKVLMNIPPEWRKLKVYNDLNQDLYKTFKVLQDPRKRKELERKLRLSFLHHDTFRELKLSNLRSDIDMRSRQYICTSIHIWQTENQSEEGSPETRFPDSQSRILSWLKIG